MTQDNLLTITHGERPTTNGQRPTTIRRSERGYILLMLMLFVTLLVIAAGVAAPTIAFRVRRDREEEMIHRGTQYSRAIQRYVKKTGRYPSRLEDLENTNNIRFLRRRYKDPITGKDFKLLHVGEVQLTSSPASPEPTAIGSPAAQAGGAALQGQPAPCSEEPPPRPRWGRHSRNSERQPSRRLWRGRSSSQPGFAGCVQIRLQPGWRDWQRSTIQRGFRRRPNRWRRQHQQGHDDSRIQSQEPLQPVAVHLRSNHGPRRPDHHPGAACVAIGSPVAAAELIQPQLTRNARALLAECRVLRRRSRRSPRHSNKNLRSIGMDLTGEDARPPFFASTIRSISITPIHWRLRVSVYTTFPPRIRAAAAGGRSRW